jgi:hypothetical protein
MAKLSKICQVQDRESSDFHVLSAREILAAEVVAPREVQSAKTTICPHYQSDIGQCEETGKRCENSQRYKKFGKLGK